MMNEEIENPEIPTTEPSHEVLSPEPRAEQDTDSDIRLYLPDHGEWEVQIKRDSERIYCYSKLPGEDWFHLILNGEIFVSRAHERYCLRCALRLQYLTQDRLFWQRRVLKKPPNLL